MLKYNKAQYFNIQSTYREIYFRLSWVSLLATSVTLLIISELPMFLFFLWQEFGKSTKKVSADDLLSRTLWQ